MAGRVDGKVAIVTGGASGMGRIMARALLDNGAKVAAVDRNPEGLASFMKEAAGMGAGDRLATFAIDVRLAAPVAQVVACTIERRSAVRGVSSGAVVGGPVIRNHITRAVSPVTLGPSALGKRTRLDLFCDECW